MKVTTTTATAHTPPDSPGSDSLLHPSDYLVVTREQRRIGTHLLMATCALTLISAGAATVIFLWMTALRGVATSPTESVFVSAVKSGYFLTYEGMTANDDGTINGKLVALTMTTITSQLITISSPFLVAMMAYGIAGVWLDEQQHPNAGGTNLPTPLQYGLLVKLSSTAGIMSLYDTGKYFLTRERKNREALPSLLTIAFVSVIVIYGLTHIITLTDLWLHLTSESVPHNVTKPFIPVSLNADPQGQDVWYGVAFNDTLCNAKPIAPKVCLTEFNGWAASYPYVAQIGMLVSSNVSSSSGLQSINAPTSLHPLSVITLADEDDLAVIVPTSEVYSASMAWEAPTFGIRSKCSSITQSCTQITSSPQNPSTIIVRFNCSDAGYPWIPYDRPSWTRHYFGSPNTTGRVGAYINGTVVQGALAGFYRDGGSIPSNPQSVQIEMEWPLDISIPLQESGAVTYETGLLAKAFVDCEMEFYNVTVRHRGSGEFELVDGQMEMSSPGFTAVMWEPLIGQMVNLQLHANLLARALSERNDDNFIAALNQELSRLTLGMFSGALTSAPASNFQLTHPLLVGRYPVPPVLAYIFFLYLYASLVLAICYWASTLETPLVEGRDGRRVPALALAQNALTDPLVLVGMAFPRGLMGVNEGVREPMDMFGERRRRRGKRGMEVVVRDVDLEGRGREGERDSSATVVDLGVGELGAQEVDVEGGRVHDTAIPRLRLGVVREGEKAGMIFGVNELGEGV